MKFHAQVAHLANSRTEFRFLNGASPIILGDGTDNGEKLRLLNTLLDQVTPLSLPLLLSISLLII